MPDEMGSDAQRGRLGRLFAALVGNEDELAGVADGIPATGDSAAEADDNTSLLDMEALSRALVGTVDPIGALRGVVADVRRRTDDAQGAPLPPSPFELYLATRLTEAGIAKRDAALPAVTVVRPHTSDLFYLRVIDESLPWVSKMELLRIEAALNCALLIERSLERPNDATLEELVRCEQRIFLSLIHI